jgi:hypothetical protein
MIGLWIGGGFAVAMTAAVVYLFMRQARREERDRKR